jgi:hypothetical protein
MRRLVWIHAGRKPIMLVLSWRGSYSVASTWYTIKFIIESSGELISASVWSNSHNSLFFLLFKWDKFIKDILHSVLLVDGNPRWTHPLHNPVYKPKDINKNIFGLIPYNKVCLSAWCFNWPFTIYSHIWLWQYNIE